MSSISALLEQGQTILSDSVSPLIDTQILLCHVLKVDHSYLYKAPEEMISAQSIQTFMELIEQRRQGIPVSYLTGHREFWSLDLKVDLNTLIPRPETEHLVEAALNTIEQGSIRNILDLGTGTGAIALSIAHEYPNCIVIATDISSKALDVARQNLIALQLNNVIFKQGDWCEALDGDRFDLIVSNPPYIAEDHSCLREGDVQFEPVLALKSGPDGLDAIRKIIEQAPDHLNSDGWLILEHGYDQKESVQQLFSEKGFQAIETLQDYAGLDRVTLGQWTPNENV